MYYCYCQGSRCLVLPVGSSDVLLLVVECESDKSASSLMHQLSDVTCPAVDAVKEAAPCTTSVCVSVCDDVGLKKKKEKKAKLI